MDDLHKLREHTIMLASSVLNLTQRTKARLDALELRVHDNEFNIEQLRNTLEGVSEDFEGRLDLHEKQVDYLKKKMEGFRQHLIWLEKEKRDGNAPGDNG